MTEPLSYDSDRLIRQWRERYTARRTVAHQMLNDAELLVRDAIALELAQHRRESKTQREYDLERRERAVEFAEGGQQWRIDRLRRQLAEAETKIASLSPRVTQMREERETVEVGTVVRLMAPTVPSYGDKTSPRPWMLGELEDVIYRLRLAGGGEDTEVRFKRDAIEACVPFAEFALTTSGREEATADPVHDTARQRRVVLPTGLGLLLIFVLLSLVVVLR
jgi:hypothetical protein